MMRSPTSPATSQSAEKQATQAAESVLATFASEVSESRSMTASPMLSLLLGPKASLTISVVEGKEVLGRVHQATGLADMIAALSDAGILGARFSAQMLDADYFPERVECRSAGVFVPEGSKIGVTVRYSRTTVLTFAKGRWLIARDWLVLFP